jgi:hypothetical protein
MAKHRRRSNNTFRLRPRPDAPMLALPASGQKESPSMTKVLAALSFAGLALSGCATIPLPTDAESVRVRADFKECSSVGLAFIPD